MEKAPYPRVPPPPEAYKAIRLDERQIINVPVVCDDVEVMAKKHKWEISL